MNKTPITRQELSAKVLAAIREHPKCASVKEITITPIVISDAATTWHVNILDSGDADIQVALTVTRTIQERLSSMFEVTD